MIGGNGHFFIRFKCFKICLGFQMYLNLYMWILLVWGVFWESCGLVGDIEVK